MSRDVTASVGYDYILIQVNSAFANFILPIECDYLLGVLLLWSLLACLCGFCHSYLCKRLPNIDIRATKL